jgi:hypothetical protein
MQSDASTCPHCGAIAGASPDPELIYCCDVCGGPRMPVTSAPTPSGGLELPHLRRAEALRKTRARSRASVIGWSVAAALVVPVAALLLIFGVAFGGVVLLALAAFFGGLAARSVLAARTQTAALAPAVEAAWQAAAAALIERSDRPLTASDIAGKFGIPEARAEELLAFLEASDLVRGAARGSYAPRMRIADGAPGSPSNDDLAAALAEMEADAAEAARDPSLARTPKS